ncbi:MAG: 4-phosphoerythronate dehydrogenase [Planctomycetota bacterium]|nr:4-phosphoerythronate dehydrogenase [Planctomycetota bacterium]
MRLVVDENIPCAPEAFADLGEVRRLPGRSISRDHLLDADILVVRSVTKVDRSLLTGTRVRFVATATSGCDHVDESDLSAMGIGFASAHGSNANSVAEWVTAALLRLAKDIGFTLEGKTLGIIGVGAVGSRVEAKAATLGMKVLRNDPPRARREGAGGFVALPEILAAADAITLHVPLIRTGCDRTVRLVDANFLRCLRPGTILLNASRGAVVDESALRQALAEGRLAAAALDVFENEPFVARTTLAAVQLATPHIAGYSTDAKIAGTAQVYAAICRAFGKEPRWNPAPYLPPPPQPEINIDADGRDEEDVLDEIVAAAYDIAADHCRLAKAVQMPADAIGEYFTRLRKDYPLRREFPAFCVKLRNASPSLLAKVKGLGFLLA